METAKINQSPMTVRTFYHFVELADLETVRTQLKEIFYSKDIRGTIILAPEGINGTVSGAFDLLTTAFAELTQIKFFKDLSVRDSAIDFHPFSRMKVKIKKELVPLGQQGFTFPRVGQHVEAQDWNKILQDPDVIVIDTRNNYEVSVGQFKNAINPKTRYFRDFVSYIQKNLNPDKNKKVAMYCTGGIRCEKASAYMLEQGFDTVYQLKGGILSYLEQVDDSESLWQGECFVFDHRVSVKHGLKKGQYQLNQTCGHPLSFADQQAINDNEGFVCPFCKEKSS